MEKKDILTLLAIILGIALIKLVFVASKKLQLGGVSNKERWRIIREPKTGRLLEIEVYRDVKEA